MPNSTVIVDRRLLLPIITLLMLSTAVLGFADDPKYRTFTQSELSEKKAKDGKAYGSSVCFTFRNDSTGLTVNSLHVRFNSAILSIVDNGGFTNIDLSAKRKVLTATGRTVSAGDSVTLCFTVEKKAPGTQANYWWWDTNGVRVGEKRSELASSSDQQLRTQPNGGNVRDYLYKKVIRRPAGLMVGMKTDTPGVGWIRYMKSDRKYFPQTGAERCLDYIVTGSGGQRSFVGELKNPHVKKHDNKLLGDLHALKLAIIANDSGVTEPESLATKLGDLIYNDASNPTDMCNGKTIREIVRLADSAMTYCSHFAGVSGFYGSLYSCIHRIIEAFSGSPIQAKSFSPFVISGAATLPDFLQPNPEAIPASTYLRYDYTPAALMPSVLVLEQNYPNPFNPTTTIDFSLPEISIVTLKVFNILGQQVATLVDTEEMEDGDQSVHFDAYSLTSGVYLYKLTARGQETGATFQSLRRMVLMK